MFKYSKEQIIGLIVSFAFILAIAVMLRYFFRNKRENIRKIPQQIITILIFATELAKNIICATSGDFNSILPYSFCSFFWFWFVVGDFTAGKFSDSCNAISFVGSISMSFLLVFFFGE